jgi:7-keto-8-aminopelargonate synthetase-like enzyme
MDKDIIDRLRDFMDNEAKSCSMDFGCITPEYVYRMWGDVVPIEKIEAAMVEVRRQLTST